MTALLPRQTLPSRPLPRIDWIALLRDTREATLDLLTGLVTRGLLMALVIALATFAWAWSMGAI